MSRVIGALCCAFAALCAPASAATDGQLVAIARTASGDRLVTLNPDGTGVRTMLSGQRLSSPGWSPDGNRIVVADGHRVLVLDPATGQTQTVLDEQGAAAPTWAPDGRRIALLRGPDVLTIGADGSDPRTIAFPFFGQISWLAWSPAGDRLAYGTSGMLRTIGIGGDDDAPLVTATELGEPAWSPDAKRIAYRDDGRLLIVPAAGGEPVDLTRTGGVEPDWSPDGREVVYAFGAGLRATGADGGVTRPIATPVGSAGDAGRARLAAVRGGGDGELRLGLRVAGVPGGRVGNDHGRPAGRPPARRLYGFGAAPAQRQRHARARARHAGRHALHAGRGLHPGRTRSCTAPAPAARPRTSRA